jgi:hypothetical protein
MTTMMDAMTFFGVSSNAGGSSSGKRGNQIASGYFVFSLCAVIVYRLFTDADFSSIYTLGMAVQCLAFYLLNAKVDMQRSVSGISAKTLQVYVLVFVFRLTSTMVKNGYLPVDQSGDWVFQTVDILSLIMTVKLLRRVYGSHRATYQEEYDTFDVFRLVPPCIVLAMCVHGHLNSCPFFDTCWTTAMNLDSIAMLPQLWMLAKIGGEVDGMTSHFVVALAFSRLCGFAFWFYGYVEIHRVSKVAGYQLLFAHAMQVFLSLDFVYYYLVARMKGKRMQLPTVHDI